MTIWPPVKQDALKSEDDGAKDYFLRPHKARTCKPILFVAVWSVTRTTSHEWTSRPRTSPSQHRFQSTLGCRGSCEATLCLLWLCWTPCQPQGRQPSARINTPVYPLWSSVAGLLCAAEQRLNARIVFASSHCCSTRGLAVLPVMCWPAKPTIILRGADPRPIREHSSNREQGSNTRVDHPCDARSIDVHRTRPSNNRGVSNTRAHKTRPPHAPQRTQLFDEVGDGKPLDRLEHHLPIHSELPQVIDELLRNTLRPPLDRRHIEPTRASCLGPSPPRPQVVGPVPVPKLALCLVFDPRPKEIFCR